MSEDIIIGYKRLIPTKTGWRSPAFPCEWTDRARADSIPAEDGSTGIHAVFDPKDCSNYFGSLVSVQAMGKVIIGELGFRCEEAIILDYNPEEREAFRFFDETANEIKIELGIRCALLVYPNSGFRNWADDWINGKDRSRAAAWTAARAAGAAARAWAAAWVAGVAAATIEHPLIIAVRQYKEAHED